MSSRSLTGCIHFWTMSNAAPILLAFLLVASETRMGSEAAKATYYSKDLFEICPGGGSKKEINMRTTFAAIFTLQVFMTGVRQVDPT